MRPNCRLLPCALALRGDWAPGLCVGVRWAEAEFSELQSLKSFAEINYGINQGLTTGCRTHAALWVLKGRLPGSQEGSGVRGRCPETAL